MVVLDFFIQVCDVVGFDRVMYYNGFFIVEVNGGFVLGYSLGEVQVVIEKILVEILFNGMIYEWIELMYQ